MGEHTATVTISICPDIEDDDEVITSRTWVVSPGVADLLAGKMTRLLGPPVSALQPVACAGGGEGLIVHDPRGDRHG